MKLQDGTVCQGCMIKAGVPFKTMSDMTRAAQMTCREIRGKLEELENSKQLETIFSPTKNISTIVSFDDNNQLFRITKGGFFDKSYEIYSYEQILDFELLEDGETITSGGLGRAAVGAALFGGVGAVVGGVTGGKKTKGICTTLQMKITLRDSFNQSVYITFLDMKAKKSSLIYKEAARFAQDTMSALQLAVDKVERTELTADSEKATAVVSAADEILKFKELMDAGIITTEEFEAKKKQLLGI